MGLAMQNWAAPVGRTQALRNAQVFLLQRGLTQQPRLQYKAPRHAQAQDDVAAYYIFNIGDNQGFAGMVGLLSGLTAAFAYMQVMALFYFLAYVVCIVFFIRSLKRKEEVHSA